MRRAVTHNKIVSLAHARAITLLCAVWLAACGDAAQGPEAQLRQWVTDSQSLIEEKQRRQLLARISPSYTGSKGYSRDDLNKMLRAYFLRQNNITLLVSIEDLQIYGETAAEVNLNVGMAGTNDGLLGISADAYRFELELQKQGDDWMLISARWGALGEELK